MNKKEEIFTIGDKTTLGIITCFRLLDNEIMVDFDNKNSILLKSKQLQHIKQPLFTTEDGVDIFEGDEYWSVNKQDLFLKDAVAKNSINVCNFTNGLYLLFSTKEKAEEYIIMNKPVLCLQDIINTNVYAPIFMEKIKKIIEQKLNK